jgi:1,4-dihydroxy-2-naphthoate octaprenyltransferase
MASAAHWSPARAAHAAGRDLSVLAGTGVAAYDDEAVWWKALLASWSPWPWVGVNYANDYSDGVRGTDADGSAR